MSLRLDVVVVARVSNWPGGYLVLLLSCSFELLAQASLGPVHETPTVPPVIRNAKNVPTAFSNARPDPSHLHLC